MAMYRDVKLMNDGAEANATKEAVRLGNEIANRKIDEAYRKEQERAIREEAIRNLAKQKEIEGMAAGSAIERERMNSLNGFVDEGVLQNMPLNPNTIPDVPATGGLGMGPSTLEGVTQMNRSDPATQGMNQEEMVAREAMSVVDGLRKAKAKGATPQNLNEMLNSIPDYLKNPVMQLIQTDQNQSMQKPVSPVTAASQEILQNTLR